MPRKLNFVSVILSCCAIFVSVSFAQTDNANKPKKTVSVSVTATATRTTPSTAGPTGGASTADNRGGPIAMVAGQPIYENELQSSVAPKLMQLRNQEYQIKRQALDNLIDQKLLEAEAKKKGVSTDKFLEQEVDAKIPDTTDAEAYAYYLGQRNQLNRSFEDAKTFAKNSLKQAKIQQARQDFYAQMRKEAQVAVLLQAPKVDVSYDPARVRGNPKAPVMIVEFADFQCPYCQAVESTLKSVLVKHEGQVAIAFRDMPLTQIHPLAQGAAEAARCAGEQGKFWEYHDLLFTDRKLDKDGLENEAQSLKLDQKQFDSCITSGRYKVQIDQDAQDGRKAGVNGTPAFFINGVFMDGAQPESAFEEKIQDALATAQNSSAKAASNK